jgi:hypothetical protein
MTPNMDTGPEPVTVPELPTGVATPGVDGIAFVGGTVLSPEDLIVTCLTMNGMRPVPVSDGIYGLVDPATGAGWSLTIAPTQ